MLLIEGTMYMYMSYETVCDIKLPFLHMLSRLVGVK